MAARYLSLVIILTAVAIGMFSAHSAAVTSSTHIDTEAGVRFTVPFPLYQRKSPLQVGNLIKETFTGDLSRHVVYSSAVYADGSDDFIVVWRQPHTQLPSRHEFRRLSFIAPLKSGGKVRDVAIAEQRPVATFALGPTGPYVARVALVLTRADNVFIGYYSRSDEGAKKIAAVISSLEVDPGRAVGWSDLDSGLKPMWSGVIIAGGFLVGFLGWMLMTSVVTARRPKKKKSGGRSTPDFDFKSF